MIDPSYATCLVIFGLCFVLQDVGNVFFFYATILHRIALPWILPSCCVVRRTQEVTEWVREDEFGNIVARGIVGEDDPYDDGSDDDKQSNAGAEGVSTNRCVGVFL